MTDNEVTLPRDTDVATGFKFAKVLVWAVYAYFVLAVVVLVLNFFMLLFNASATAEFTQWVYRNGDRVLEPFRGIFPSRTAGNGSVIDFAVLFAIIMYGIAAMVFHGLISWIDGKIAEERDKVRYLASEQRAQQQRTQR